MDCEEKTQGHLLSRARLALGLKLIVTSTFVLLLVQGFLSVYKFSVDVPYGDEWEALNGDQLPAGLRWAWLIAQHNEHRIVFTRLETYALFYLDHWDLAVTQWLNYVIFAVGLVLTCLMLRRVTKTAALWPWLAMAAFMLSPRFEENHLWGFQLHFHLAWMFTFLAAALWFRPQPTRIAYIQGAAACTAAIYSLSGGVATSAVLLVILLVYQSARLVIGAITWQTARQSLWGMIPTAVALVSWRYGYVKPTAHPPLTPPFTAEFCDFFFNLVASGLGIDTVHPLYAAFGSVVLIAPFVALLWADAGRFEANRWLVLASAAAVFGFLASVAMGRAGFDMPQLAKASRYLEISSLLVPLAGAALWLGPGGLPSRLEAMAALWLTAAICSSDHWAYTEFYQPQFESRTIALTCLENYYYGHGPARCNIYRHDMTEKLENAKKLEVSFYRKIVAHHHSQ